MSSINETGNNQGPIPAVHDTGNNANVRSTYMRDPQYYYEDGSAVFVVDGILFKLQASLVLGSRSTSQTLRTSSRRYSTGVGSLSREFASSTDDNPIPVLNATASQFRNFLFAVLGLPSDPTYLALLTDAQHKKKHSQDLLVRYLDISRVARGFRMSKLEEWAQSQLCLVLESMYDLALDEWDKETLLRLDSYAQSTSKPHIISSVTTFIQYFVSISANNQAASQQPIPSNLDTCLQLYRDPNLPKDNPAIFGCVFASILSLGHYSTVWTSLMSNKDRAVLYAAQVQFTSVSEELKNVGWLQSGVYSLSSIDEVCSQCQAQLGYLWSETFGKCGGLKSNVALEDVTSLARLPQYRRALVSRWNAPVVCFPVMPKPSAGSAFCTRNGRCNFEETPFTMFKIIQSLFGGKPCSKLKHPLLEIDRRIRLVYEELAWRHKYFVSQT